MKLAYWLATQGAQNIHLHLTTAPSAVLESQMNFFQHLQTRLIVWSSAVSPVNSPQNILTMLAAQNGCLVGVLFALDTLLTANSTETRRQSEASASLEILDEMTRTSRTSVGVEQFVVLSGAGRQPGGRVLTARQVINGRNSAGLPGLLLELPTLGQYFCLCNTCMRQSDRARACPCLLFCLSAGLLIIVCRPACWLS